MDDSMAVAEVQVSRLTPKLLTNYNYQSWHRAAILALQEKDLYDIVSCEELPPKDKATEKEKYKQWLKKNSKAMSAILHSIDSNISELFIYQETSKDMWDAITAHFQDRKNHARIYHLKKELHCITQQGRPLIEFTCDLKKKWEELNLYIAKTTDPEIIKEREHDKIYQFLTGLDEIYEQIRSNLLQSKELPSLDETIQRVHQEESKRLLMKGKPSSEVRGESTTMAALRSAPDQPKKGKKQEKCENCKKEGHSKEKCWFLYPELKSAWWSDEVLQQKGQKRWQ